MKVVLLTGDHPRHVAVARAVDASGLLAGLVVESREAHVPAPPSGPSPRLQSLVERHFLGRAHAEEAFFGGGAHPSGQPVLRVSRKQLNSPETLAFIKPIEPDLVLSYGVHKLTDRTLASLPPKKWNIHGGLSPWYRGVITHFWPSYQLEPQFTGMTLHELSSELDAGSIVHQNAAPLVRGDGVHELACRAVSGFCEELGTILRMAAEDRIAPSAPQAMSGKLWTSGDWRPEHLVPVYELWGNRIVDAYLDGEFEQREPSLVRQHLA